MLKTHLPDYRMLCRVHPEGARIASKPPVRQKTCPLDGIIMYSHPRCSECGILVGLSHERTTMYPGELCSDCYSSKRRR